MFPGYNIFAVSTVVVGGGWGAHRQVDIGELQPPAHHAVAEGGGRGTI